MSTASRNAIGSYRSKLVIEEQGGTTDGFGHLTGATDTVERVIWGSIISKGGTIQQFADQSFAVQQSDISMRYRPGIEVNMHIRELNGAKRRFRIISTNNVDGRNEKLVLRCVEAK